MSPHAEGCNGVRAAVYNPDSDPGGPPDALVCPRCGGITPVETSDG